MGNDKLKHVTYSFVICYSLALFLPLWGAILITAMIGIAKELVWDLWLKKGTPELTDFLADLVGIVLAGSVTCIMKSLLVIFKSLF